MGLEEARWQSPNEGLGSLASCILSSAADEDANSCAHQSSGCDVVCCAINASVCMWERTSGKLIAVNTLRSNVYRERGGTGSCFRLFSALVSSPLLGRYQRHPLNIHEAISDHD